MVAFKWYAIEISWYLWRGMLQLKISPLLLDQPVIIFGNYSFRTVLTWRTCEYFLKFLITEVGSPFVNIWRFNKYILWIWFKQLQKRLGRHSSVLVNWPQSTEKLLTFIYKKDYLIHVLVYYFQQLTGLKERKFGVNLFSLCLNLRY